MRLWVTRTEPGASATADRLRRAGHDPVVAPALVTQALPNARLDLTRAAALAFTSRNAVDVFGKLSSRRDLPVFATGEATAAAARNLGFSRVSSADGGVADLAALILQHPPGGDVIWPGPTEPAGDLAALLAAGGLRAWLQPVYRSLESGEAPPALIDGIVIHSPKAARAVARVLREDLAAKLVLFAISPAAAEPLLDFPFSRVSVAPRPNETALLSTIAG